MFEFDTTTIAARELLTAVQLKTLELAELTAAQVLTKGMEANLPYKVIFQSIKTSLEGLVIHNAEILCGYSDKGAEDDNGQ